MSVIDFHNHLGVDLGAELSQTADELLARMDEAAIDQAIVFPFPGCPDLSEGNAEVARAARDHADRLIPFFGVDPRAHRGESDTSITEMLTGMGARGIIIDPAMHHFSVRLPLIDPLMQACERLALPVVVQFIGHGNDDCSPFVELAARHPNVTLILSPLVYCPGWAALVKNQPNIYADTAKPMYPGHLTALVTTLGAERVLFGSETPYMAPIVEREKFKYAELAPEDEALVLGGNAERLLSRQGAGASAIATQAVSDA